MAKNQAAYVCQSCGASYARWTGRCEACGEWNSIVEELRPAATPGGLKGRNASRRIAFSGLAEVGDEPPRRASGLAEFDRVTGGGRKELNDYLRFLGGGCSKDPLDLLRDAGVDMEKPQPVDTALNHFTHLVDELDNLL